MTSWLLLIAVAAHAAVPASPQPSPSAVAGAPGTTGPMSANARSTLIAPSPSPAAAAIIEPYVRVSGKPVASGEVSLRPAEIAAAADPRYQAGDAAFLQRKDEKKAREALQLYRSAYFDRKSDPEAGWRLAMACYFVGLRLTKESDEKKELFAEGREAGKASVAANSRCAPCHFWTAINIALYGEAAGVFKQVFQLGDVKEHLKASIAADPGYAYSGAYRLLGTIEQKLPGILGGSNHRARENFERAIAISPEEPLNYLFLARLLSNELSRPNEGLEIAKRGLKVSPPTPDRVEAVEAIDDLKEFVGDR